MNQKRKRIIWTTVKTLGLIYLAGGIVLYFIQDLLLFHPKPLPPNHLFSFTQPFQELNIPVDDRNLSIIKFRTDSAPKGIVLFFHGNMENVEHYSQYPSLFTRNGFELWMIDYPGFGKSTGKRNEKNLYRDALLMYEKASKEIDRDSIIVYGKSIGTGVAAYLASERPVRRLILETPYYSMDALEGVRTEYDCAPHSFNKTGETEGELVGGNLALLAHLIGTPSDSKTKHKILFLEDVGEYLYNIDRMLLQLKRSGKFDKLAGLIFGGFTDLKDTERPFGKTIREIIREQVKEYDFPVCFDFPVSHEKENYALKIGVNYTLKVQHDSVRLEETLVPQ